MISIVIGGDLCPEERSAPSLARGETDALFDGLAPKLSKADLALANLEGPLVQQLSPIAKIGPHHSFDEKCIKGIQCAGFHLLNLGNNHVMDHGHVSLQNTIRCCEQNGIAHVGAGENLTAAGQVWIKRINGIRLGILSYTEHEFGLATATTPGTNPLNIVHFIRTVQAQRAEWDYLLVLLHCGNEYYPYPRPALQELCRFMVEQGADAVICQHSHCAGSYEKYQDGHIVYGQGNLLCDSPSQPCEREGMLVVLKISGNGTAEIEFVPFAQTELKPGPVLMGAAERADFLGQFEERSKAILDPSFIDSEWENFCQRSPYNYLGLLHGYPRRIRELNRKFPFMHLIQSQSRLRMLLHLLRCESHHEAIIGALNAALK